jgi:hypothetical protein
MQKWGWFFFGQIFLEQGSMLIYKLWLQCPCHDYCLGASLIAILSSCLGFKGWFNCNTFIMQTCWFNNFFVGTKVVSHKSDDGKVPLNHAMEDVNWVHEGSRWICKFNGCIDSYMAKWLLRWHLDNKHSHHMEACKFGCPSIRLGGRRQQNDHAMNAWILNNPQAWQTQNENKVID